MDRCARRGAEAVVEAWDDYGETTRSAGNFLRRAALRLARALGVGKPPAQQLFDLNATVRQLIGANKTLRTVTERAEDLRETYEAMRDATQALTEDSAERVAEAEQEVAADGVDDAEREAYFALVEEADHHQSDAAAIEELEDVYTGEADVVETLGRPAEGGGGTSGGATCGSDYEEFRVDDKTSTCVWSSLVEWSCYAGSRQVSHPDLGGANACLYYSLDFVQPDGACRENYAKVTFQGRDTCRWADLGADRAAWYTLEKENGVESPQTPTTDPALWCWANSWGDRIWTLSTTTTRQRFDSIYGERTRTTDSPRNLPSYSSTTAAGTLRVGKSPPHHPSPSPLRAHPQRVEGVSIGLQRRRLLAPAALGIGADGLPCVAVQEDLHKPPLIGTVVPIGGVFPRAAGAVVAVGEDSGVCPSMAIEAQPTEARVAVVGDDGAARAMLILQRRQIEPLLLIIQEAHAANPQQFVGTRRRERSRRAVAAGSVQRWRTFIFRPPSRARSWMAERRTAARTGTALAIPHRTVQRRTVGGGR